MPKQERKSFYGQLHDVMQSLSHDQPMIILGDFNARIESSEIPGVKQIFNENILNDNG